MALTKPQQTVLLTLAWESIAHGLKTGKPLKIDLNDYPPALACHGAAFVALELEHQLRGCIGSLKAVRPLAEDVCENAFAAAFCDKRFTPLTDAELADIEILITLLSARELMTFNSEVDLMAQLRPHIDGLALEKDSHHAAFLPDAWESLHSPMLFLEQLKHKAGLPATYWSKDIKVYRFTTEHISWPHK